MRKRHLNQWSLAKAANVSQSTVCRALQGKSIRQGSARARLFKYAKINELPTIEKSRNIRHQILEAFDRVWDHSEEHAVAIARVIDAMAGLRPRLTDDGE